MGGMLGKEAGMGWRRRQDRTETGEDTGTSVGKTQREEQEEPGWKAAGQQRAHRARGAGMLCRRRTVRAHKVKV